MQHKKNSNNFSFITKEVDYNPQCPEIIILYENLTNNLHFIIIRFVCEWKQLCFLEVIFKMYIFPTPDIVVQIRTLSCFHLFIYPKKMLNLQCHSVYFIVQITIKKNV